MITFFRQELVIGNRSAQTLILCTGNLVGFAGVLVIRNTTTLHHYNSIKARIPEMRDDVERPVALSLEFDTRENL